MNDKNELAMDALRWIVDDLQTRKADVDSSTDDFTVGKRTAYFEMLEMIESRLDVMGIELESLKPVEP